MATTTSLPASSEAALRDRDITELLEGGRLDRAFEMLVERYEGKVFRLCSGLLQDPAAAQDAAQESLIRVWRALPRYDGRAAALSTWIYAITRNRCLTALQQRLDQLQRNPSLDDEAVLEQVQVLATRDSDRTDASALARLIEELPVDMRQVLKLFYFEDRAVAEVALMLGLSRASVKTRLFRARARLLDTLQAAGLGDASQWLQ
jgi:RNA polymerase sigma-70 factor (ECF subfamily)